MSNNVSPLARARDAERLALQTLEHATKLVMQNTGLDYSHAYREVMKANPEIYANYVNAKRTLAAMGVVEVQQ